MKIHNNSILIILAGLILSTFAWSPSLIRLSELSGDQTFEDLIIQASCYQNFFTLGWYAGDSNISLGIFTPTLTNFLLNAASCSISAVSSLNHVQSALAMGIILTFILAYTSCRVNDFLPISSGIGAFLITTAPCAFSRIGHIWLATLWPVLPGLTACYQLWQVMMNNLAFNSNSKSSNKNLPGKSSTIRRIRQGAILATLCVPSQEYYIFFILIILGSCYIIFLILASTKQPTLIELMPTAIRGLQFGLGFGLVLLVIFIPKFFVLYSSTIPLGWATPRYASEQFTYGLLPLTWIIPSPLISYVINTFQSRGIATSSESYFWSAGSLIIPISWAMGLRCLSPVKYEKSRIRKQYTQYNDTQRFYSLLLFIVTFVGLLWMTMGGLGTLLAAYISPIFRSLNRFTVFIYGSSLMLILSYFDAWIRHSRYSESKPK